jgi:hypothetical protein
VVANSLDVSIVPVVFVSAVVSLNSVLSVLVLLSISLVVASADEEKGSLLVAVCGGASVEVDS